MAVALEVGAKRAGRVLTPTALADALCQWAIQSPADVVLDLGVGEGAFLLAGARRLLGLGALPDQVADSLYGAELDLGVFARAQAEVQEVLGQPLPHVLCGDFLSMHLPVADAVVGNPPYIRRHHQVDPAAHRAAARTSSADGMTDAYCHFLLRACHALAPGGRLAVVVSASWMDMRYGETLKRSLLAPDFSIRLVLGFEGRIFKNALVKTVVLLVERVMSDAPVPFARLGQEADLMDLPATINTTLEGRATPSLSVTRVARSQLAPEKPWSVLVSAPAIYEELLVQGAWVPLRSLADSRIGLQSFAKPFYLLTRVEADRAGIEAEYLMPLAFSPRDVHGAVLNDSRCTRYVVFACDRPLTDLHGTGASRHIQRGMGTSVQVRGTDQTVLGYHQAPRLQRAGRNPWYDVRTEIVRRGTWPILIPRRAFTTYIVVHNLAGAVPNEDFLELRPHDPSLIEPLLALLNASLGELLVRLHSFQYGGGVFNMNPGALRTLPLPDLTQLGALERQTLVDSWHQFVEHGGSANARAALDTAVATTLAVPEELHVHVKDALRAQLRTAHDLVAPQGVSQLPFAALA